MTLDIKQDIAPEITSSRMSRSYRRFQDVDQRITLFRPSRALATSVGIWLILFAISPIQTAVTNTTVPLLFLALGLICIWLGAFLGEMTKVKQISLNPYRRSLYREIYLVTLTLGALGVALRLVDWFLIRGLSVSISAFGNRELLESVSVGGISVAAHILLPLTLCAAMLRLSLKSYGVKIGTKFDVYLAAIYPALTILIGGRSVLLFYLFLIFVASASSMRKIRLFHILIVFAILGSLAVMFNYIILNRIGEMGLHYTDIASQSGYTVTVPLKGSFFNYLSVEDNTLARSLFLFSHYAQYALHGVFEFCIIFNEYSGTHTYGTYQGFFLAKLVSSVLGLDFSFAIVSEGIPRIGVYDTFYGSAFVDFGYFAPIFGFVFGFWSGITWKRAVQGEMFLVPLASCMIFILAMAPFVNALLFAGGLLTLISFFGFSMLRMMFSRKNRAA